MHTGAGVSGVGTGAGISGVGTSGVGTGAGISGVGTSGVGTGAGISGVGTSGVGTSGVGTGVDTGSPVASLDSANMYEKGMINSLYNFVSIHCIPYQSILGNKCLQDILDCHILVQHTDESTGVPLPLHRLPTGNL